MDSAGPEFESATGPVDLCHVVGGAIAPSEAPLVVTIHDLAFLHHPGMFTRHGLRFFRRALQLTIERARLVFVPSMATLEDCVAAGIDRARLRHVPWGVTVSDPDADDVAAARARFGLTGDYVVMVGTLEPRKNLLGMLEAWRLLGRDADLVVVGPEGWGDAIDPALVPDRLVKTGFVSAAVRDALYRGAAVSVYPSLFEGFGLPVLESMALGCPVVTSSGTSTAELVVDGAGIAVDPTDPSAIADAIAGLLDDPSARQRTADEARRRASTYTWERAASAVVDGYQAVLA
ncbi:glycosyltransferase family 4 protein [Actinospongicola halichondriae]|uniref:glycosyltransferase family 4 protein n=1 Tax=Actinospongicola halichondriae TaxID=3236844 RepID=UPI003D4B65CA